MVCVCCCVVRLGLWGCCIHPGLEVTYASKFPGLDEIVPLKLTAYRFHTEDPIVWHDDFTLQWQNGMDRTGGLAAKDTALDFSVLVYEWTNDDTTAVQ